MQKEETIETLDPALFTTLNIDRVGKLPVSKVLAMSDLMGYDQRQVLNDKLIREAALRELAYRIKYN